MKTIIIAIETGNITGDIYACGRCFYETERKAKYCTNCGAEFVFSENDLCCPSVATNYEQLKKNNL